MQSPERKVLFVRPLYLVALVWVVMKQAPVRVALPRGDRRKQGQAGEFFPACFYYNTEDKELEDFILTYQFALGCGGTSSNVPHVDDYADLAKEPVISMADIRRTDAVAAALRYYVSRDGKQQSPWIDPRVKDLAEGLMAEVVRLWEAAEEYKRNKNETRFESSYSSRSGGEHAGRSEGRGYQDEGYGPGSDPES